MNLKFSIIFLLLCGICYGGIVYDDLKPNITDSHDLGTSSLKWEDAYFNGTITGGTFTDGTFTATGGNFTGMGNITGTDVDINAGTGDFATSGIILGGTLTDGFATLTGGTLDLNDFFIENAGYVQFDLDFSDGVAEGRLQWNSEDGTLEVGMPGGDVTGQILQEMLVRVTNDTGSQIDNGTPVYISDATGTNIKVTPADADFAGGIGLRTFAVTTEDISAGQKGYVTTQGFVRDIDTSFAVAAGLPAYLAVGGGFTTTTPAAPNISYLVGIVTIAHASAGEMYVIQTSIPNLNQLSDVVQDDPKDGDILTWDNSIKVWQNDFPTIKIPIVLPFFDPTPARSSESNIYGGILSLVTGDPLDSVPTDIVVTKGIGKVLIVVNAGGDFDGDILITGETIDRDTGASDPGGTDTISIDAISTDNSTTDANGNIVHGFENAYISAEWFTGSVTLSTSNLTLTDVDVYHLSFEQFNGEDDLVLDSFDINLFTTNVNAEFDAYLYDIHIESASKCNIENHADLHVGAGGETAIADKYWRLRRGGIAQALDGSTDGIWIDIHYSNPGSANVEDVSGKVWATKTQVLDYEDAPPSDLLLETGDSLLLETGDKLLLES